jgi:uncharacterized protein
MRGESSDAHNMTPQPRTRRRRALDATIPRALKMPPGHRDYTVIRVLRVPMRDGVELLTDVYEPVGQSLGTLLIRTHYGRTGVIALLTAGYFATHGYQVVNQSCRGTFGSGGVFEPYRPEIDDGADTVAWLRNQGWFGGRFALWGVSNLGATAWALMMDPPPELAAAVIGVSAHDNYWAVHGSGAFALDQTLGLLDALNHQEQSGVVRRGLHGMTAGRRLKPGFQELPLVRAQDTVLAGGSMPYREWLTTTDPEDPLWRPMRLGEALERVNVPILLQEGWQDPFPEQMIHQYERLRRRGLDVGLTIGPWTHVQFATKGIGIAMDEALDWLAEHLARTGRRPRQHPIHLFVTGAQEWRWLPEWPPATTEHVLYLQPDGALGEAEPPPAAGPSVFTYDPADPTPSVGGRMVNPATGGYRDNRELEERDDVLTFTSPVLSDALEVIGSPVVELLHHTDNPHADLFVRLCDVSPKGRSINVSDGFRRLEPEKSNGTIQVRLDSLAHRFAPGTRIRLQVSGGAHPRYARNLGTDKDPATSTELAPSRRTISHGDGGASRILLPCPVAGQS